MDVVRELEGIGVVKGRERERESRADLEQWVSEEKPGVKCNSMSDWLTE